MGLESCSWGERGCGSWLEPEPPVFEEQLITGKRGHGNFRIVLVNVHLCVSFESYFAAVYLEALCTSHMSWRVHATNMHVRVSLFTTRTPSFGRMPLCKTLDFSDEGYVKVYNILKLYRL